MLCDRYHQHGAKCVSDPIIGLAAYNAFSDAPDYMLPKWYCQAILAAGGIPLLLPFLEDERPLRRLYETLDGLLLCGGGDVAPIHYGAGDGGRLVMVEPQRDGVELVLTRWALGDGRPILGICRGAQVLNVAAGGTLIQDIPLEVPGALLHRTKEYPAHEVTVERGSLLAQALADGQGTGDLAHVLVNSRHHQAVQRVAPGFVVSATAPDGVIEAIERRPDDRSFVLGVQWHPENLVLADAAMARLFRHFVNTCQR
jgi:putative glutamine amidotransferase